MIREVKQGFAQWAGGDAVEVEQVGEFLGAMVCRPFSKVLIQPLERPYRRETVSMVSPLSSRALRNAEPIRRRRTVGTFANGIPQGCH